MKRNPSQIKVRKKSHAIMGDKNPERISRYYLPSSIPIAQLTRSEADDLFDEYDLYMGDSTELVDPIRSLMLAVMIRAWRDCNPSLSEGKQVSKEAQEDAVMWLEERLPNKDNPFSLQYITDILEFDKEEFKRICLDSIENTVQLTLFAVG